MLLWDVIRDFFVAHITGGYTSNGLAYYGNIGNLYNPQGEEFEVVYTHNLYFEITDGYQIAFGDWLATTCTIIALGFILVLCCKFIYKVIRIVGGLVSR